MLTALLFICVVDVEYISGISLAGSRSVTIQWSSAHCFILFSKFSMNINISKQKTRQEPEPTLSSSAHQSITCLPFSLLTPTSSHSNSVLQEEHYIPTQTSENLWHSGLQIIKTLQAQRGLKLCLILRQILKSLLFLCKFTQKQHSVLD